MSKLLRELLNAEEPLFSLALQQLERASGKQARDVKLTAEIIEKTHRAIVELGLDPNDSTGPELYTALLNQAKKHDDHLAQQLGITDPTDAFQAIEKGVAAVNAMDMPRRCWALKDDVAADFLRQTPPPHIMERLGYSNIEDLLANEPMYEVYGALRFAEDGDWLNAFNEHYKRLTPDDFHSRDIALVVMPKDKWGDIAEHFIAKKRHINTHLKELGVVLILPPIVDHMTGITSKVLALTFHYYNEVRLYSSFFKLQAKKPNFGKIFVDTLLAEPAKAAVMAGHNIHWRVIQRYFAKLGDEQHPEIFQPHVQPEDLHWRRAEDLLYQLDPELKFWQDMDYVAAMYDGRPITFNFIDVFLSYANGVAYEDRYVYHFQESLWNEIFMRYMGSSTLKEQILNQLDNDVIAPEKLQGHH